MSEEARYTEIAEALHRRLRVRGDYSEIVSQLRRTPSVPPRASDIYAPFPNDEYLSHLTAVMWSTYLHREATARQLMERAALAETIEIRNRSVIDAVALLTEKEIAPREWRFTEREKLGTPPTQPHAENGEVWNQLSLAVAKAYEATPANFEEMLTTFVAATPRDEHYDEKCYTWCCFHLPYINIDLGTADADRDTTRSRLNQMADLCGEPFLAEEIRGLGERRIRLWVASNRG